MAEARRKSDPLVTEEPIVARRKPSGRNVSNAERGTKLRGVRLPPELDARIQAWIKVDPKNRTMADVFAAGIDALEKCQ